jgi:hypothetical protein
VVVAAVEFSRAVVALEVQIPHTDLLLVLAALPMVVVETLGHLERVAVVDGALLAGLPIHLRPVLLEAVEKLSI